MLVLFCIVFSTVGQEASKDFGQEKVVLQKPLTPEWSYFDLGLGFGLDYGGVLGVKGTFSPIPYVGVFVAGGWEMIDLGWNIGCIGRFVPGDHKHLARPYVKVMYGVNSATKVQGMSSYNKIFYGFTAGAGIELRFGKRRNSGINLDLNVPFRSPDFITRLP